MPEGSSATMPNNRLNLVAQLGDDRRLREAREDLHATARAIDALARRVDHSFSEAVRIIAERPGKLIITGLGKSGHIAKKAVATLTSTGTQAVFLHAAEAFHGDLGLASPEDTAIAISHSGETKEVVEVARYLQQMGIAVIGISGNAGSRLASLADIHLEASIESERCPLGLAPTTSTTVTLALLDTLAIALMRLRNFRAEDFARCHPGGSLGRMLLSNRPQETVQKGAIGS